MPSGIYSIEKRGGLFKKGQIPWSKDKKFSEKHKRNLSEGLKNAWKKGKFKEGRNKKISESHKGKPSGMSGKKQTKEARQKISANLRGEKSSSWKGGKTKLGALIRSSFKNRQWRSDVFTRDDFTCQNCSKKGGWIEADHYPKKFADILDEYQIETLEEALSCEELWNINNGRTLCRKCHILTF